MATGAVAIDPNTGERVSGSSVQIDPATGERVSAAKHDDPKESAPDWRDKTIKYLSRPQVSKYDNSPVGEDATGYMIRRGLGGASKVALHPIDSAMGLIHQADDAMMTAAGDPDARHRLVDQGKSLAKAFIADPGGTIADQIGQGAAFHGVAEGTGVALDAAKPVAARVLGKTGAAAEAAGNKLLNETVGSYKKDFNRGANPGRGYNEAVGGPSLSMRSLAAKADHAKNQTGQAIGNIISESSSKNQLVPISKVVEALSGPLKEQYDLETGPGGLGNTAPYENYSQGFKDIIQQGVKKGGLTADQVFELKKSIAKRTKWSNQTPEGIMDVRQGQVGALGGLLTEMFPELKQLNQNYQDLVGLSDRAAWRAESGSKPFGSLVREGAKATGAVGAGLTHEPLALAAAAGAYAADTVPGRTAVATGLYKGGKGLQSLADRLADKSDTQIPEQLETPQMIKPRRGEPLQDYIRRKKEARGSK